MTLLETADTQSDISEDLASSKASSKASTYYNTQTETFYPINGIRAITPSYVSKSQEEPIQLSEPQNPLVILDLNGTLIYREDNFKRTVRPRPHLASFLSYLFENCRVMVWSSVSPESIDKMLRAAFDKQVGRLDRIWTRKDFRLHPIDYNRKVLTLKDLEYVWEAIENERNAQKDDLMKDARHGMRYDQTNTVLIDDSPHKSQLQPFNCIVIPEYDRDRYESVDDVELVKVRRYMETLVRQQNVGAYMRIQPFDSTSNEYNQECIKHTIRLMDDEREDVKHQRKMKEMATLKMKERAMKLKERALKKKERVTSKMKEDVALKEKERELKKKQKNRRRMSRRMRKHTTSQAKGQQQEKPSASDGRIPGCDPL
ncbi:hypothetical protein BGZ65_007771 [Modicella reniformis]|uniref:Mitochondrial import inner membrane translocase subunit TIM50 n=1 Tax=Modicella reniformis TaxID=1440133 RepID=A0A9P6J527_9FUNG|nr:hypothetical protein BGZ65_007771 [Modicella reniformis]